MAWRNRLVGKMRKNWRYMGNGTKKSARDKGQRWKWQRLGGDEAKKGAKKEKSKRAIKKITERQRDAATTFGICIGALSDSSLGLLIKAILIVLKMNQTVSRQPHKPLSLWLHLQQVDPLSLFPFFFFLNKRNKWLQLQLLNKAEIITCAIKSTAIKEARDSVTVMLICSLISEKKSERGSAGWESVDGVGKYEAKAAQKMDQRAAERIKGLTRQQSVLDN